MTRNRFNQAKHKSTSTNNLTLSKACGLFPEDNDNIDMMDTYKITNVHPPIDEKDVVNKEYRDNNLLSSSKYNQLKQEFDNNKFNLNITYN